MKLGLGTAQFGLDYGISNGEGRTPASEVKKILPLAAKFKMPVIDTAPQYGSSEKVIGRCLPGRHPFKIVTKTPVFKKDAVAGVDALFLKETFHDSLRKLRQKSVYALLVHHSTDLLSGNGGVLWQAMEELKEEGVVEKIGVSVYSPDQVDSILGSFRVDLIQFPLNVLDQRMIQNGRLRGLKALGIEVHSRSAFLQGLLLMSPARLPKYFSPFRQALTQYFEYIRATGLTPAQAALAFVCGISEIDVVIVGVNEARQLEELCRIQLSGTPLGKVKFSSFPIEDEMIINPCNWK